MTHALAVGIIGCGNISETYLRLAPKFRNIQITACADLDIEAAKARAKAYGVQAISVEQLLADETIDVVVNLTIPDAHFAVSRDILSAGKHLYSEKPLALSVEDGQALEALARDKGRLAGCAPDTYLGGAHQAARAAIDAGRLGRIVAGSAHVMSHGMEHWHPNPDFFFKPGGGPVLDVGPYYIANLINLIGPVRRVAALASIPEVERVITSEPRSGEFITVETPTDVQALIEFHSGASVTFSASWNVWAHGHSPMEVYGTEGSLFLPDPNFFGGDVVFADRSGARETLSSTGHPFSIPNETHDAGQMANYRTAGLADLARAITEGGTPRCSLDGALHALDVMQSILRSGADGSFVTIGTTCERPEALSAEQAQMLLS